MKSNRTAAVALSIAFAVIVTMPHAPSQPATRISRPFQYSGYSSPQYKNFKHWCEYVALSDATKLAAAIYLPSDGPAADPFPAILWYLPGHREKINPATGELLPFQPEAIKLFTSNGYAWVVVEMRGSGASYGSRFDRGPQIAKDGKELVDWIAAQPWCNGNVGMVGGSYQGFSQYATAGEKPAALKAIFPEIAGFDEYSGGLFYPGGILNTAITAAATSSIARDDLNHYIPSANVFPSAPVVDEDGDGELVDEIPLDKNQNGTFLDDGPPVYADAKARQDLYYNATSQHLRNVNLTKALLASAPYRDSTFPGSDYTYMDLGPNERPRRIAESGIAVYDAGGWFDYHIKCTTQWFSTLKATNPIKMLVTPSPHTLGFGGPYVKYFGVAEDAAAHNREKLRFFDHYLKGIDNGIDREPPIYLYVMGEGWRFEEEWPIGRQVPTEFFFAEGHSLSRERKTGGSDSYKIDMTADSRNGQRAGNRWDFGIMRLKDIIRTAGEDRKRLTYTSGPLEEALEVTGHPIVRLWVSSSANDGDFFVYLEDVDHNGESYFVTDGLLRANFAKPVPIRELLPDGPLTVLPDLPWHGFNKSDYMDAVFAGGRRVELELDLMPTSWVFKKGHRIRVAIAGADWPTFELHPKLSPGNDPGDERTIAPTVTVYRDAEHPSSIVLPVIPRSPTVFTGTLKMENPRYDGTAELYAFEKTIYLRTDRQWLKYNAAERVRNGSVDQYRCEGGVTVSIRKDSGAFAASAAGPKMRFQGKAK